MNVYTQEMLDNDEVATVGMRVIYNLQEVALTYNAEKASHIGEEMTVVANLGILDGISVVVSDDYGFSDVLNNAHYLPVKPPQEDKYPKAGDPCSFRGYGAIVVGDHPTHPVLVIDSDEYGLQVALASELDL